MSDEIIPYPLDPRYGVTRDGRVYRIVRGRFGKPVPSLVLPTTHPKGYLVVGNGSGKGLYTTRVHQIVARTFIPNPDNLPEVAHNDGVKKNNRVENLRWSTTQGNQIDRLAHGTHNRGTRHGTHKLTEEDVTALRRREISAEALANVRGCWPNYVRAVQRGKGWPHVVT